MCVPAAERGGSLRRQGCIAHPCNVYLYATDCSFLALDAAPEPSYQGTRIATQQLRCRFVLGSNPALQVTMPDLATLEGCYITTEGAMLLCAR